MKLNQKKRRTEISARLTLGKKKTILKIVIRGILVKAKRYRQQFALIYQRGNG